MKPLATWRPSFWQHGGGRLAPALLAPLAGVTRRVTARRVARAGWQASVPVICCGNATVGGAGKTILALDLARRLIGHGIAVHFLSRGHGGRVRGPHQVSPDDPATRVGDEPKLLAAVAPTWVDADRARGARAAMAEGARALIMDDGLQNAGLIQDLPLLVIDGATGFGNGRMLPAGPLREPVAAAAGRCRAAVLIGADTTDAARHLGTLPVLRAWLTPGPQARALTGKRVLAFAGIGFPDKFFRTLEGAGADIVVRHAFPDHHPFTPAEMADLLAEAERHAAIAVTTAKDAVRIDPALHRRIHVADVTLSWQDPELIEGWLRALVSAPGGQTRSRQPM